MVCIVIKCNMGVAFLDKKNRVELKPRGELNIINDEIWESVYLANKKLIDRNIAGGFIVISKKEDKNIKNDLTTEKLKSDKIELDKDQQKQHLVDQGIVDDFSNTKNYDDLEIEALRDLASERKINFSNNIGKNKLIEKLQENDLGK